MSKRTEVLAGQFQQANAALIQALEPLTDAQWRATCVGEGWSVGVAAHHIADWQRCVSDVMRRVTNGDAVPPLTADMITDRNAKHAREFASCTKDETLEILSTNGAAAAAVVRGLTDEQLPLSIHFGNTEKTIEWMVQRALIGHIEAHGASIRQAI